MGVGKPTKNGSLMQK